MTAACGHVPLSVDAAQRVVADQIAQLAAAAEALPAGSSVRTLLDGCLDYAHNAQAMLDAGISMSLLLGALGRHVAATAANETVATAMLRAPVATDLWLALGGHTHTQAAPR